MKDRGGNALAELSDEKNQELESGSERSEEART